MTPHMELFNRMVAPWKMAGRSGHLLITAMLLAGCASVSTTQVANQHVYVLEAQPVINTPKLKRNLVLAVSTPRARHGFDTNQIAYVKHPHELNYFVTSRWAATPARMLEALSLQALEQTGSFRSIVRIAGAVPADVILDIELIRLQQNFEMHPSRVQLTLQAQLIDAQGKRVLAVKQFDESENSTSEDAYGGVVAANRAVQRLLDQLAEFCVSESVIK